MIAGDRQFSCSTHVMAIINLTPDSFWQGSRFSREGAAAAAERAAEEGAEILDIGAQSTRPGHTPVSAREEISRLKGVISAIKKRVSLPVSVDTFYAETARYALGEGADMINDVWGLTYDKDMAKTIAGFNASVCIMHNAKTQLSGDMWGAIEKFLRNSVDIALQNGIAENRICLDGGIGFAKSREQNFELLEGYERLSFSGYPLLLGVSRKSMFGGLPQDRLPQTLQATRLAVRKGITFVRVHDVAANVAAIRDETYKLSLKN